jgi:hypothetical protein
MHLRFQRGQARRSNLGRSLQAVAGNLVRCILCKCDSTSGLGETGKRSTHGDYRSAPGRTALFFVMVLTLALTHEGALVLAFAIDTGAAWHARRLK